MEKHNELSKSENGQLADIINQGGLGDLLKPLVKEIHLFDTFIAGTSRLKDPSLAASLKPEDKLSLLREENKFDDNAIAVLTSDRKKLGYIPEKDNTVFARLMDAGKMLSAHVKKVEFSGSLCQITIGIYLVDF